MTWQLIESKSVSAQQVYEILKKHRLLPASIELSAGICNSLASSGTHYLVYCDEENTEIADVFVSGVIQGDSAQLDLIPVAKFFRTGFDEPLREAMNPLLNMLFNTAGARRLTSSVPASRSRTKRALCSLGFVPEGRLRSGVALYDKKPEDLRVLGMVREDFTIEGDSDGSV